MKLIAAALMVLVALQISGCGKRARFLDPPDEVHEKYPKRYPPKDSADSHL